MPKSARLGQENIAILLSRKLKDVRKKLAGDQTCCQLQIVFLCWPSVQKQYMSFLTALTTLELKCEKKQQQRCQVISESGLADGSAAQHRCGHADW